MPRRVLVAALALLVPCGVFAGPTDSSFESDDGGLHWFETDEGLVANRPLASGCDPDSGRSAVSAESVVVDPRDANQILAVVDRRVFRTASPSACLVPSDQGLDRTPAPCLRPINAFGLSTDPQQPEALYLNTDQGVYRSTDSGQTWMPRSAGIPFVICEADVGRVAIDPARSDVLFVDVLFGIYKSENGGENWEQVNNGFPPGTFPPGYAFAFDPRNTDVVYLASDRLFKTSNGAQLWQASDEGLPGPVYSVTVDLRNPDVVHAGTPVGLFVSADAGASWALEVLAGQTVRQVVQNPATSSIFYAITDAGLFQSTNGGVLSSPLATPFPTDSIHDIALAPSDPSTLYAATGIGVYRSRDDGASWQPLGISLRTPRTVGRQGP